MAGLIPRAAALLAYYMDPVFGAFFRAVRFRKTSIPTSPWMDLVFGPVMWRLIRGRRPLTEDDADTIVNSVLNGLRATTT